MMKTELIEIPMVMVKEVVVRVVLLVKKGRMQVNLMIRDPPKAIKTTWEVLMLFDSEAAARVSGAAETVDYFG